VLGGQHICKALLGVLERLKAKDVVLDTVPENFRMVSAQVLQVRTPLPVCRVAAGLHQLQQHDVRPTTTADVCRLMARNCSEKQARDGDPFLRDHQVWQSLSDSGVVRSDQDILRLHSIPGEVNAAALKKARERQVCNECGV
jgi:hypothetical protein